MTKGLKFALLILNFITLTTVTVPRKITTLKVYPQTPSAALFWWFQHNGIKICHLILWEQPKKQQSRGYSVWHLLANILILKQVVDVALVFFPHPQKDMAIEYLSFNTQYWVERIFWAKFCLCRTKVMHCQFTPHCVNASGNPTQRVVFKLCEQH